MYVTELPAVLIRFQRNGYGLRVQYICSALRVLYQKRGGERVQGDVANLPTEADKFQLIGLFVCYGGHTRQLL